MRMVYSLCCVWEGGVYGGDVMCSKLLINVAIQVGIKLGRKESLLVRKYCLYHDAFGE